MIVRISHTLSLNASNQHHKVSHCRKQVVAHSTSYIQNISCVFKDVVHKCKVWSVIAYVHHVRALCFDWFAHV